MRDEKRTIVSQGVRGSEEKHKDSAHAGRQDAAANVRSEPGQICQEQYLTSSFVRFFLVIAAECSVSERVPTNE